MIAIGSVYVFYLTMEFRSAVSAVLETIYLELDYKKVSDFPQEYSRYFPLSIINVFSISIAENCKNLLEEERKASAC